MNILLSQTGENIIFVTAVLNIVAVLLLVFTCRFVTNWRFARPMTQKGWYKSLSRYHSYIWWLLLPAFAVHAVIAMIHKVAGG